MTSPEWKQVVGEHKRVGSLAELSSRDIWQRVFNVLTAFETQFDAHAEVRLFSAPGRVELCGNHTDHQQGCVVALAVDLDIIGAVSPRPDQMVCLLSQGQPPCLVNLSGTEPLKGTSEALIYGVANGLRQKGYITGGFNCCMTSLIPVGSGLSSSAAFENFVATVFNSLYNQNAVSPLDKALAGQWAENCYFGKPSGLMDQLASCLGGVSFIDFADSVNPVCKPLHMPLQEIDRMLCVVNTGGSHADLTAHYAAIPAEMQAVAGFFGQTVLSACTKGQILENLPAIRKATGDRAVLRALNYFDEIQRCNHLCVALEQGNMEDIPTILEASGMGSQCWLQNISNPEQITFDGVGLALYLSKNFCPAGTFRVHGGGFGGTILGLVPVHDFDGYQKTMETVFGVHCCIPLQIRSAGGVEITL